MTYDEHMASDAEIEKLGTETEALKAKLDSYRIYFTAAMRATSLGLCKRAIKHALEEERRMQNGKTTKRTTRLIS